MLSPSLRQATASEPLTLDEEYAMQQSWRSDGDKLTFIICQPLSEVSDFGFIRPIEYDGEERMVGDVNLFLFPNDEGDDDGTEGDCGTSPSPSLVGELELMIALPSLRRKGYGRAALLMFVAYVLRNWDEIASEYVSSDQNASKQKTIKTPQLDYLRVKINEQNTGSIALFESLRFVAQNEGKANFFGEVEMRWLPGQENVKAFMEKAEPKVLEYRD
jgi:RimJ/RimL family protein N-acetyltransferase